MIDLYSAPTANGHRVSIMLEECGLPYRAIMVDLAGGEHLGAEVLAVNPVGQIPAIRDSEGPDGAPLVLAESLAILRYLTEKAGRLLPTTATTRAEADRWCSIVEAGIQPNFSAIHYAKALIGDPAAPLIAKFRERIERYLPVMDSRLAHSGWLAGETISYVDLYALPVVATSFPAFAIDLAAYPAIRRWRDVLLARPAVARGLSVPG